MTVAEKYNKATDTYLGDLRCNNKSAATVDKYSYVLSAFGQWLERQGDLDGQDVTPLMVIQWKQSEQNRKNKTNTLRHYMIVLHTFFGWCVEHGIYDKQPVAKSDLPKAEDVRLDLLTEDEILTILSGKLPKGQHHDTATRNRAMITLLLESGLRASELLSLRIGELDFERNLVRVIGGKGDKDRVTTFPMRSQCYVREYLNTLSADELASPTTFVFGAVDKDGVRKPFTRQYLTSAVKTYVKGLTGRDDIGAHDLRHAYASTLLTRGAKLEEIQSVLGHASYATTVLYAEHLAPKRVACNLCAIFDNV